MTREDIDKLPDSDLKESLYWDLCSRWTCCLCGDDTVYLIEAAVIGNYCCGACGMSCLRPDPYLLETCRPSTEGVI